MTVRTSTLRKPFSAWAFFLIIAVLWPIHTWAGFLYDQLLPRDPGISKSDDRRYALYIPSNYSGSTAAPLVIALHGCHQTERMVADKSRLEEIADRDGFIVAYLYIAKSDLSGETNDEGGRNPRCWGFWFADEIHRGRGEVADVARLIDRVKLNYNVDMTRVHIIGISSGGAMATAALVAYPDKFASGAILDGVGYAETSAVYTGFNDCDTVLNNNLGSIRSKADVIRDMRNEMNKSVLRQVPVMVVHNRRDCTVPLKVGQAIVDGFGGLMAQEGKAVDVANPFLSTSGTTAGISWTHNKYGNGLNGASLIETVYLDAYYRDLQRIESRLSRNDYLPQTSAPNDIDRGHAWFGAKRGPWFLTVGPFTSELAWGFFKDHPYVQVPSGSLAVNCSPPIVSGKNVTLTCSATGNNPIASYRVVLAGPSPKDEVLPGATNFSKQYDNLADGNYTATITATDSQGNVSAPVRQEFRIGVPPASCVTASNSTHISSGRAHACGFFLFFACANGSNDSLGYNFVWTSSSVKQTGQETWAQVNSCQ